MTGASPNLCSHPYRVMLRTQRRLQAGGMSESINEHVGVSTLDEAERSVEYFLELMTHPDPDPVFGNVLDCWIEYIYRHKLGA